MEDFSQDLRHMAKTRIFALSAIIFFIFLTIFVVILLSSQSNNASDEQTNKNGQSQISRSIFSLGQKSNVPIRVDSTGVQNNSGSSLEKTNTNSNSQTGRTRHAQQTEQTPQQKELERITKNARPLPKVLASSYKVKTAIPPLPDKVNIYSFKTNYSDAEVLAFAARLGVKPVLTDRGNKTITMTDLDGNVVSFDKSTGSYAFASQLGIASQDSSKSPAQTATNFLKEIGASDSTIIYTATYNCPGTTGSTCVEFHRDWRQVGFPIFDVLGLYNLAPNQTLKSLRLGEVDPYAPKGSRPNHFNSATVEIDNLTGRIKAITSSIRPIARVNSIPSSVLKTPQEALADIENGRSVYSLAIPTGAGFVDLEKAYPSNLAVAQTVTIDDIIPAYWENNPMSSQSELQLFYLACGTTTLNSGYGSRVCQVVPVIKGAITSVLGESTKLAQTGPLYKPLPTQTSIGKADSLQYGTLEFEGTTKESGCPLTFTNSYKIGPGQYIAWQHVDPPKARAWYLVLTNEDSSQNMTTNADGNLSLEDKARAVAARNSAWRACSPRLPNVCQGAPEGATVRGCYYIMTASPSLYLYPAQKAHISVSVNPEGGIAYQNPAYNMNNSWSVMASPDGDLALSNSTVDSLYYEFNKSVLTSKLMPEKDGYIVAKTELTALVRKISKDLALTEKETQNWVTEVERETKDLQSNYIRVSLISPISLISHIPLTISPEPTIVHRLMLAISKASKGDKLSSPSLSPLPRPGFTVVETGIIVK